MNKHPLLRNPTRPISRIGRSSALALIPVLALAGVTPGAARSKHVVPAVGAYKASGRTDPASYDVRAEVKRRGGRKVISAQVTDTCGGFATFVPTAISRGPDGAPTFSAQVGAAAIRGRWTTSSAIKGTVRTPCAKAQGYVMHLAR